jgi:hypothetical protein
MAIRGDRAAVAFRPGAGLTVRFASFLFGRKPAGYNRWCVESLIPPVADTDVA